MLVEEEPTLVVAEEVEDKLKPSIIYLKEATLFTLALAVQVGQQGIREPEQVDLMEMPLV